MLGGICICTHKNKIFLIKGCYYIEKIKMNKEHMVVEDIPHTASTIGVVQVTQRWSGGGGMLDGTTITWFMHTILGM